MKEYGPAEADRCVRAFEFPGVVARRELAVGGHMEKDAMRMLLTLAATTVDEALSRRHFMRAWTTKQRVARPWPLVWPLLF